MEKPSTNWSNISPSPGWGGTIQTIYCLSITFGVWSHYIMVKTLPRVALILGHFWGVNFKLLVPQWNKSLAVAPRAQRTKSDLVGVLSSLHKTFRFALPLFAILQVSSCVSMASSPGTPTVTPGWMATLNCARLAGQLYGSHTQTLHPCDSEVQEVMENGWMHGNGSQTNWFNSVYHLENRVHLKRAAEGFTQIKCWRKDFRILLCQNPGTGNHCQSQWFG